MHWTEITLATENGCFYYQNQLVLGPFLKALPFHAPGLAPVCDSDGWFHIQTNGIPLYNKRYFRAFGYYEDRAAVINEDGWFHINIFGNKVYKSCYKWCGNFQNGACTVQEQDYSFFHISPDGTPLYKERFLYAGDFYDNCACVLMKNQGFTHIDKQGNLIHGRFYQELGVFHKGFATAKDDSGWFHINKNGYPIYEERFNQIEPFYNGWAYGVKRDNTRIRISESAEIELIDTVIY